MRVQGGHLPPTEVSPPFPALLPTDQPSEVQPGNKPLPSQSTCSSPAYSLLAELFELPLAAWPPSLTLTHAWRQQCKLLGLGTPRASLPVWRWLQEDMFWAAAEVQSKQFYVSCDKLESQSKATAQPGAKVFRAYESVTTFATGALSL